jgi:hypothetical protein
LACGNGVERRSARSTSVENGTLTLHGMSHTETLAVHFIGAGVNLLDKKYTVGEVDPEAWTGTGRS